MLLAALSLAACRPAPAPPPAVPDSPAPPANPLFVAPTPQITANAELRKRLEATPHGYYRFINRAFAQAVCVQYRDVLPELPTVNLHGDAHLEQYAITTVGRGLEDFDDSVVGPLILDVMRFAVSIELACAEHAWSGDACTGMDAFLAGYRTGLDDPSVSAQPPDLVARAHASFDPDRIAALARAEALMQPLGADRALFHEGPAAYVDAMVAARPDLPRAFFVIKTRGRLQTGVGSALDEKFLFRIEGASERPDDDLILEAKPVRDLDGIECLTQAHTGDADRIVAGQARIAYRPYDYAATVALHPALGHEQAALYWVHEWVDHYREVSIGAELATPDDLAQVAKDVGVQLGLGHPKGMDDPEALRSAVTRALDELEPRIRKDAAALAEQTHAAWLQFGAAGR